MIYIVTINNRSYEVEVEKGEASILKVTEAAAQSIPAASQTPAPLPPAAVSAANGNPVTAPMPGTIISIKVSTGDKIKKGDVLFVLEAMKMENEITAPVDGVVIQIAAAKGSSVSTGDILAVIQSWR